MKIIPIGIIVILLIFIGGGIYFLALSPAETPAPPDDTKTSLPIQSKQCIVGGCSSELCVDTEKVEVFSPCIYKEEFACYKTATCEMQQNGECGWTQTAELLSCVENARSSSGNV